MNVKVINLRKDYGRTVAVNDINFSFTAGHVFGFVGPNGAGKTTTMRILATLDEPTSGDAFIDGHSVCLYPEEARRRVGFVPDALPEHGDITVHEYLDFFARAYGLRSHSRRLAVDAVEDFTQTGRFRHKTLNALSKGMKQRVSLARALVHDPPVLILDEPAAGLDPRARVELRELLHLLAERKKAILVSSHILTELTEICNGVIIIERGNILEQGTLVEVLTKATPLRRMCIRVLERSDELCRKLMTWPRVDNVQMTGDRIFLAIDGTEAHCSELLGQLVADGFRVSEFTQRGTDLEQLFMAITKGEL